MPTTFYEFLSIDIFVVSYLRAQEFLPPEWIVVAEFRPL